MENMEKYVKIEPKIKNLEKSPQNLNSSKKKLGLLLCGPPLAGPHLGPQILFLCIFQTIFIYFKMYFYHIQ